MFVSRFVVVGHRMQTDTRSLIKPTKLYLTQQKSWHGSKTTLNKTLRWTENGIKNLQCSAEGGTNPRVHGQELTNEVETPGMMTTGDMWVHCGCGWHIFITMTHIHYNRSGKPRKPKLKCDSVTWTLLFSLSHLIRWANKNAFGQVTELKCIHQQKSPVNNFI